MDAITLQLSSASDLGSMAIRAYDHGPWSHVDAVMEDGSLLGARDDVCAGVPAGVRIRPANYHAFEMIKRVIIPTTPETATLFYGFLNQQLNKPYDHTSIMGFVFGRDWRDDDSWFCSELQATALEKCGFFAYPLAAPANKITPNGLFMILSGRVRV